METKNTETPTEEIPNPKLTVKEFYDYVTKFMTPEEALMKLLKGSLMQYEKLKFDSKEQSVHPVLIISMAAMDMGWQIATEKRDGDIRGIAVGTEEYMKTIFKTEMK